MSAVMFYTRQYAHHSFMEHHFQLYLIGHTKYDTIVESPFTLTRCLYTRAALEVQSYNIIVKDLLEKPTSP